MLGVVVALAGPLHAVGGEAVPLLAGHFARFAADAERGVGEEAHCIAFGRGVHQLDAFPETWFYFLAHACYLTKE